MGAAQHPVQARMDAWVLKAATSECKNPDEADKFIADELAHHPGELEDFQNAQLHSYVVACFGVRQRAILHATRRRALRDPNSDPAGVPPLADWSPFDAMLVVDDDRTKKRVGLMTAADHLYVSKTYSADAKYSALHATFHKTVARRLGDQATEAVFKDSDYDKLYRSTVDPHGLPRVDDQAA